MSTWTSTTRPVSLSIAAIPTSRATPLLSKRATVMVVSLVSVCLVPGRDVLGRAVLVRAAVAGRVMGRDVLARVVLVYVVLRRDFDIDMVVTRMLLLGLFRLLAFRELLAPQQVS